ncbi:MAG: DUF5686 and carboxypeptidase regulatory-like domain-containing protein [Bacteroidales bacterium]|nr:DUF5686 and carboxypeptidase regulatory-like domain-containing protein [Bacteroidales bacterium]
MSQYKYYLIFLWILFIGNSAALNAQTIIKGTVVDRQTNEPLSFANVTAPGSSLGDMTDINGKFSIQFHTSVDSIVVTYVGYKKKTIGLDNKDYYKIGLQPVDFELSEVTVTPGKNPAHRIIKNAVENRDANNPQSEGAFKLETYNKIIANIDKDLWRTDTSKLDSSQMDLREEFSDKNLFIMETASRRFFEAPDKTKEEVLHTQVSGMKSPFFFIIASQLQSFTFYEDLVNVGGYRLVNPISPGSTKKYWFRIEDTTYVNGPKDTVFTISFKKRGDRSFKGMKGVVNIGSDDFAIRSVIASPDVSLQQAAENRGKDSTNRRDSANTKKDKKNSESAIEIEIQQKYEKVEGKKWFPDQLNMDITLNSATINGFPVIVQARSYIQNVEMKENIKNKVFDENYLEMNRNAAKRNDSLMSLYRRDSLTYKERNTYTTIDSISEEYDLEKKIKAYRMLLEGYIPWGPLNFALDKFVNYNVYEGFRLGAGISLNEQFSGKIHPMVYAGWGTKDHTWKYGGELEVEVWEKHEVSLKAKYHNDLRETGALPEFESKGLLSRYNLRNYLINKMDKEELGSLSAKFRMLKYAEVEAGLRRRDIQIFDDYRFGSYRDHAFIGINEFRSAEVFAQLRFAFRERHVKTPGNKYSLGTSYPVLWLNYTRGVNILNGQLEFDKVDLQIQKTFRTKYLGNTDALIRAGKTSDNIPVSLQYAGFGSYYDFAIACPGTFNTMRINEFAANEYVAVHLEHDFKKHLFRWENFRPSIAIASSAMWGNWNGEQYQSNTGYKQLNKGYFESGVMINSILKSSISALGLGFYYRYGPYSLDTFRDNLSIKVTMSLLL